MEKGGEPVQFAQALGSLADGVVLGGYWDHTFPYPGASQLRTQFESQTGQTYSQHIADSEAAAEILLDAIAAAGSLDPAKVNSAIARTDKTYVIGPVRFDADHTSRVPIAEVLVAGHPNAPVIAIVLDNVSTHSRQLVQRWLASHTGRGCSMAPGSSAGWRRDRRGAGDLPPEHCRPP